MGANSTEVQESLHSVLNGFTMDTYVARIIFHPAVIVTDRIRIVATINIWVASVYENNRQSALSPPVRSDARSFQFLFRVFDFSSYHLGIFFLWLLWLFGLGVSPVNLSSWTPWHFAGDIFCVQSDPQIFKFYLEIKSTFCDIYSLQLHSAFHHRTLCLRLFSSFLIYLHIFWYLINYL